MKFAIAIVIAIVFFQTSFAKSDSLTADFRMPAHPRLLWLTGEEQQVQQNIDRDSLWMQVHKKVIENASRMCSLPLLERKLEGRRLLGVSREAFRRMIFWSYAYRMTKDRTYLDRAEREMLNLADFSDWHPEHFLDVAEMTMGMSIGYDWLYDDLQPETRQKVEVALYEKGLVPSTDSRFNGFVKHNNNWNQVCEAAMVFASIAIWEKHPEVCPQMVNRAVRFVPLAMSKYAPNGAYVEGCSYWGYGTGFNVLMLSAMEKVFHTDFGLSQTDGFLNTGNYLTQLTSPAMRFFNYSDCGMTVGSAPCLFWFADKTQDAGLLYNEVQLLRRKGANYLAADQTAPTSLIWGSRYSLQNATPPGANYWLSTGVNPVCTMRTGWGTDDAFVGIKLGMPKAPHGHMDVGSFSFENQGITWAMDMGGDNYNNLEQAGVDLWGMKQNGQRWQMYRYHNSHHNTLCFDGKNQIVDGWVDFSKTHLKGKNKYAEADLTPVYQGQVKKAVRSYRLYENHQLEVVDDIVAGPQATEGVCTIMSGAGIQKISDKELILSYGGKACRLLFETKGQAYVTCKDATPQHTYESQNKGITCIQLHFPLQPGEKRQIRTRFVPVL